MGKLPLICSLSLLAGCGSTGLDMIAPPIFGPQVEVIPDETIRFGQVSPHGVLAEREIWIRSVGDEPVLLVSAWLEGQDAPSFQLLYDPSPVRLAPGEELPLVVGFLPESSGEYQTEARFDFSMDHAHRLSRVLRGYGCGDPDEDGGCE